MSTVQAAVKDRLHLEVPAAFNASQPLEVARQAILGPSGLDEDRLAGVLGSVMGYSVDYADLYFQLSREESWSLEDSIVKDGSHSIEQGVGVRALAGAVAGQLDQPAAGGPCPPGSVSPACLRGSPRPHRRRRDAGHAPGEPDGP